MNSKRFCIVVVALVAFAIMMGATGHPAMAENCGFFFSNGFIELQDSVEEEFLLNVDHIVVIGEPLDIATDSTRYVKPCGSISYPDQSVRQVDVILITRGGKAEFATFWGEYPAISFVPHGVYDVICSESASYWWWLGGNNYSDCFDAVAFVLVTVY